MWASVLSLVEHFFIFFLSIWLNSVLWPLCSFIASKRISSSHIVIANFLVKNVMRNFTRMQALWNKPFFYNFALWVHRFSILWPFEIFRKNFVLLNLSTAPYSGQVYLILPLRKSWNRNLFRLICIVEYIFLKTEVSRHAKVNLSMCWMKRLQLKACRSFKFLNKNKNK